MCRYIKYYKFCIEVLINVLRALAHYNFIICLHPNSTLLTEYTLVFDKSKRINYRNKFCAQCDGAVEANTLSWPARISCLSLIILVR